MKKAQTATEYLVILAVVIVIALIVVGVLGGIPSIGGGASANAAKALLMQQDIGIKSYSVSANYSFFELVNNKPFLIQINSFSVNSQECLLQSLNLKAGESKNFPCMGLSTSEDKYDYGFLINWTDISTGASYFISKNRGISGSIAVLPYYILDTDPIGTDWQEVSYTVYDSNDLLIDSGSQNKGSISSAKGNIFPVVVPPGSYAEFDLQVYADRSGFAIRSPSSIVGFTSNYNVGGLQWDGPNTIWFDDVQTDILFWINDDYD